MTTTEGARQAWDLGAEAPALTASYEIADAAIYAHPAIADGMLVVRDKTPAAETLGPGASYRMRRCPQRALPRRRRRLR